MRSSLAAAAELLALTREQLDTGDGTFPREAAAIVAARIAGA